MTLAEARTWLSRTVNAAAEPVISNSDLDSILIECAFIDDAGLSPLAVGWAGVYELNLAAAIAFDLKASRVATEFNFSADGARYDRQQKREAFMALAKEYRDRRATSFGLDPEDPDALTE